MSTINEKHYNDFMSELRYFIFRLNNTISITVGEDFEKYECIYMKCSNGYELKLGDSEREKKTSVIIKTGEQRHIEEIELFADREHFMFFYDYDRSISDANGNNELSEEDYHILSDFLKSVPIDDMVYDKEKTTNNAVNMYSYHKLRVFVDTCLTHHWENMSLYPTIQRMLDYWGLVVAGYFISKNESFNSEFEAKIEKFRNALGNYIVDDIFKKSNTRIYIDFHNCYFHYLSCFYTPIIMALYDIKIDLEDFNKYDQMAGFDRFETMLDIDRTLVQHGEYLINDLIKIPPVINKELLFWSYKMYEMAYKNGIDHRTIIARCLNSFKHITPTIKKVLASGKKITVDQQKLYDIMFSGGDELRYLKDAIDLLNEAIENNFGLPSDEIDVIGSNLSSSSRDVVGGPQFH